MDLITRSQVCPSLAEFDKWNPMWDNHATPVATPNRNERSRPSCQPVCYNDSPADRHRWLMGRDLHPRNSAGQSCAPMALLNNPFLVFLHDHKGPRSPIEESCLQTWIPLGAIRPGNIFEFPPGSVALSQPWLGTRDVPSLTHSLLTPVPQNGYHKRHESPSTTPVHCANDTMPQYDDESAWFLTGNGSSFLRRIGLTANDEIPPTFRRECEKHA